MISVHSRQLYSNHVGAQHTSHNAGSGSTNDSCVLADMKQLQQLQQLHRGQYMYAVLGTQQAHNCHPCTYLQHVCKSSCVPRLVLCWGLLPPVAKRRASTHQQHEHPWALVHCCRLQAKTCRSLSSRCISPCLATMDMRGLHRSSHKSAINCQGFRLPSTGNAMYALHMVHQISYLTYKNLEDCTRSSKLDTQP